MFKRGAVMGSRRSRRRFSSISTSISSGLVSVLLCSHSEDRVPLPLRSSFGSERTLSTNTALLTRNFKNYARTILSCGKASSFWCATAQKNYISGAPSAKTMVCDDSNFRGGRRKRQLITSELIHLVGTA